MRKLFTPKTWLLALCVGLFGAGTTTATAQDIVFQETFSKCEGTGGDDGAWNGNNVGNGSVNSLDDVTDVPGWSGERYYAGSGCLKLGASSKQGTLTTPALGFSGDAVLTFQAHAWAGDKERLQVSISEGSLSASEVTISAATGDEWTNCTLNITGATPTSQITFSGVQSSKARFFIGEVTITQSTSGKESAGLAFEGGNSFSADLSEPFTEPTLTKATDAAATFASSNPEVATVDATTGAVSLVAAGQTTITATTPETDTYAAGSASYTLTVTDLASMPKFQKATTITSGKRYLIVATENEGADLHIAGAITGDYGYLYLVDPAHVDNDGTVIMNDLDNAFTITAVDGGYNIQQADGRYLYQSGTYNSFNADNAPSEGDVWTIKPQADGTFLITNTSVNKYVQYDSKYNSFGSYADTRGLLPMLYEEIGGKTAPTVSFAQSEVTANLLSPDAFVAPELSSTSDGAVAYTSSNPDVATVDEDGLVSLVGQGTTTITATVAETDTYTEATAEYTLTVTTLSEFRKTATVTTGKQYILTADIDGTSHVAKTVREGNGYDYLYVNDLTTANVMASADLYSFTLTAVEGGFTIQQPDGRYLYMNDDDYKTLNAGEEAGANAVWSIAQQAEGTFMIQNVATGKYIQYSTTHTSFGCYRDAQDDGVLPSLYEKATLDVTDAGYATLFSQHAIIVPEGMEAAVATNVVDGRLAIDYRYPAGAVIPASTGVLLKAEAGNHGYNVATTDATAPADNLLKGSVEDATTVGDNCLFYMLSYDQNDENLGFYWGAENGAAFTNEGGKAYLAVPQATANGAIGFALDGSLVTAIGQATADTNAPAKIYTIDGRLMQQTRTADLPRGLYIVNGKKVIIK